MELKNKRVALVGTAPSWQLVPWADTGLFICSLNDAYQLKGFQRADRWYDFHPLDKFVHPTAGRMILAHEVPPGHYLRPVNHLKWLGEQKIPVYLHPEYKTQHPPAAEWTHARPFPKAQIEALYGRYETSSPTWMLAQFMMEGCRDVSIYGIHLATESEYIEQRPGFEYLIGRILGPGKVTITVKDKMRHYTTPEGHIALPEMSPVLQAGYQYAFDPRPTSKVEPIKWELHKIAVKQQRLAGALQTRPWWSPWAIVDEPKESSQTTPIKRIAMPSTLTKELRQLQAEQLDWQHELGRVHSQVGAPCF